MRLRIENARIVDGTGASARPGSITLEGEHIAGIDETQLAVDEVLDAGGAVVCPGFIDMHSHSDFTLPGQPDASAKVLQGVTTEVVCNCGLGILPSNDRVDKLYEFIAPMVFGEPSAGTYRDLHSYRETLEGRGVSVNVACLVPHGNVRCAVMAMEEREPSAIESGHMAELVAECMEQGAFGLSTGLVYPPGAFARTPEIVDLARVVAERGGFYATHMRDEGGELVQSVEEALQIAREARVSLQISHHKAAGKANWGKTKQTLAMVDAARAEGLDVHSDVYPYTAGSTVLSAVGVPPWAFEGGNVQILERLADPEIRQRILVDNRERLVRFAKLPPWLEKVVPHAILARAVVHYLSGMVVISSARNRHDYEGKTLREVAKERRQPVLEMILDLLVEEEMAVATILHVMGEEDVQRVLQHPATMLGTDGFPQREGKPHPRTHGTYPRVLERYVRKLGLLSLESAIHKCTGMVAGKLGLDDRGVLREGAKADVLVFDPARVEDRASYEQPRLAPRGFSHVFVNGHWTMRDGKHTQARGGRVLRHAGPRRGV